jgi:hypothetical protein
LKTETSRVTIGEFFLFLLTFLFLLGRRLEEEED